MIDWTIVSETVYWKDKQSYLYMDSMIKDWEKN